MSVTVATPVARIAIPSAPDEFGGKTCVMPPGFAPRPPAPLPVLPHAPQVEGYEISEVIGVGGMGVVFKARHLQLNRIVALKILGRDALADPNAHRRFQSEAEAVARLQHPNIIQVFDVGTFESYPGDRQLSPYLSLEYVDGGSLYSQTSTPQDPRRAARLVETLARAVHAAHQVGVVHRDLKPANVLLTRDGEAKVADFGLAKQMEPEGDARGRYPTQNGSAVGTPEYMAPEQVDGAAPAPAFDIYSLGVILYELLTARVPFKGAHLTETFLMIKLMEPVSPRQLQPQLARDLETICLKCLRKSPDHRYATAGDLADDLARWLAGDSIVARPVSATERLARSARQNPAIAGLTAALVVLAIAGVSLVTWKWREAAGSARIAEEKAREADDRTRAGRRELYRANIAAASAALPINNLNAARSALDSAPDEYRNWEWDYLAQQLDSTRAIVPIAGGAVYSALCPGRAGTAVTSQTDGWRVWDLEGRKLVAHLAHAAWLKGVTFFPDGRRFASIRDERDVAVRSFAVDGPELLLRGHAAPIHHILPAGRVERLVTVSEDGEVRIWNSASGELLFTMPGGGRRIGRPEISPDGRLLAIQDLSNGKLRVAELETGKTLSEFVCPDNSATQIRFAPNGERLVVAGAYPSIRVSFRDVRTGRLVASTVSHENAILAVVFNADGTLVASCSRDQNVCLWSVETGALVKTLKGHSGAVLDAAFSADGRLLISFGEDQTIRLWSAATGEELAVLRGHTSNVLAAAFSADGRTIASVSMDGTLRHWDAEEAERGGVYRAHADFVYQAVFHPDGRRAASASWDGTAKVWDTASGRTLFEVSHGYDPALKRNTTVSTVAFSPDGKLLASVGRNNSLRVTDAETGNPIAEWTVPAFDWKPGRLTFSPDGALLACGCCDYTIRLFDVRRKVEVAKLEGHRDAVRSIAFSPDGRRLATGADCADSGIRIWDVAERVCLRELTGHTDVVYDLKFGPDGRTLFSGSTDETVRLWNTADWSCRILRPGTRVYGVDVSPDGTRLACACVDNTIRLWDLSTDAPREVAELRGHKNYVHSVAFSPDGKQILSASGDRTVRIWNTTPIRERPR